MKKLLLSILLVTSAATMSAQIILTGVSPASIEGNYEFSWADPGGGDWSTPDFNVPNTFVEGEIMLVDDGSTGTNPQGNPVSAEGCNPLVNNLTGKIAVVFRNVCEFGTKALNAQNAGAIGVIIVNREEEIIQMGGGANGLNVTIPVGFIKLSDGLSLINEMNNGPVEMFFGNRAGIYEDDLNLNVSALMIPSASSTPGLLAQNAGEYGFQIGATVYNLGTEDQTSCVLSATITDPNGMVVYDESTSIFAMSAISGNNIDSANVLKQWFDPVVDSLPDFAPTSVMEGDYALTYSVSNDTVTDDFPDDNSITINFQIDSSLFTYVQIDSNNMPRGTDYYRPSANPSLFSACMAFSNANAERMAVTGVSFSASNTDFPLTDELFNVTLFRWLDEFENLSDPNVAFNGLVQAGNVAYQYDEDLQRIPVLAEFDDPIYINNDERYLACVQTNNGSVFLGHNTRTPYIYNQEIYLEPIQVTESDGQYFAVGFGGDITPAIGLHLRDTTGLGGEEPDPDPDPDPDPETWPEGISEVGLEGVQFFPNPTNGMLIIESMTGFENNLDVAITDLTGRMVYQKPNAINEGDSRLTLDIADLRNGVYFVSLVDEGNQVMIKQILKN